MVHGEIYVSDKKVTGSRKVEQNDCCCILFCFKFFIIMLIVNEGNFVKELGIFNSLFLGKIMNFI